MRKTLIELSHTFSEFVSFERTESKISSGYTVADIWYNPEGLIKYRNLDHDHHEQNRIVGTEK